ncbi:hypothetical protein ACWCPQ_03855 [Nocardia sp. NPDC001965]
MSTERTTIPAPGPMDGETTDAASWVRASLDRCRVLETRRSLDPGTKPVLVFAIRWAPFGGATAEDLFLNFGVGRQRFLQLVRKALSARSTDDPRTRHLKKQLLLTLAWAWRAGPDISDLPDLPSTDVGTHRVPPRPQGCRRS